MGTRRDGRQPIPVAGRVIRATVEGKRRGSREDVFLVALDARPAEVITGIYLGEGSELIEDVPFLLLEDQFGAILYRRRIDEAAAYSRTKSMVVAGGVPEAVAAQDAPLSVDEFLELVHGPDRVALEVGALEVARRVAAVLPPERVPALWACQELLVDGVDSRLSDAMKGTDSYLYWALAVLYGNRGPYDGSGELRVEFEDEELDSAEDFASLASDVFFIQTGRRVTFLKGSGERSTPAELAQVVEPTEDLVPQAEADGRLFGFYFLGRDLNGSSVECAGYVAGVITYPVRDSRSVELRVRQLGAQSGLTVERLFVNDTGTLKVYGGLEIIALVVRQAKAPPLTPSRIAPDARRSESPNVRG